MAYYCGVTHFALLRNTTATYNVGMIKLKKSESYEKYNYYTHKVLEFNKITYTERECCNTN